ncbi:MAG: UDP-N-acetylmuramate--L-alanine ligase [Treponema sp.]|jgi:UDP-N-acetylmuramate--alanine ligase|nr:UDP-N-acetylmuramate--L-alanine ligase [Treponema sp.]
MNSTVDQRESPRFEAFIAPGSTVYFIGIKGTGMCALAELMAGTGFHVSGSDRADVFYTDSILKALNIPYYESFSPSHIRDSFDLVIYSAAYTFEENPEMAEARKRGLTIMKYTDALGLYSGSFDSSGIAGVHGKTTTTAMAGHLIRGAGLPAQILVGSAVKGFNNRSTLNLGDRYFVAETCEYRRHFLSFHPRRIVLTAVESDHQDYYPTCESIRDAFVEYCRLLPRDGELIYCADDPGAREVAAILQNKAFPPVLVPYGFTAEGEYRICSYRVLGERAEMKLAGFPPELTLRIPGRHEALNAAAALALTSSLVAKEFGDGTAGSGWTEERREQVRKALEGFAGSKRRQEILGEAGGILFMDDYGHHPTAIATTLEGLRAFYPNRRIVVSFMSHTYTRTASLLNEFAQSLTGADIVFLHKIYASAREQYTGGVTGRVLFEKTREKKDGVYYTDEPMEAEEPLKAILRAGDLFVTMGAGDNWPLGEKLYDYYRGNGRSQCEA